MNDRTTVWRGFTRSELDAAYNNAASIPDAIARLAAWEEAAAISRGPSGACSTLPTGRDRATASICFAAARNARRCSCSSMAAIGKAARRNCSATWPPAPMRLGLDVAMIGYTLAPEATLTEIVAETHAAIRWLRREGPGHGHRARQAGGLRLVSGRASHRYGDAACGGRRRARRSAASSMWSHAGTTTCSEKLQLSATEAAAMSPMLHLPRSVGRRPLVVTFGTRELPELQRQSRDYWEACGRGTGGPGKLLPLDHHHISILDEFNTRDGKLAQAAAELAA